MDHQEHLSLAAVAAAFTGWRVMGLSEYYPPGQVMDWDLTSAVNYLLSIN